MFKNQCNFTYQESKNKYCMILSIDIINECNKIPNPYMIKTLSTLEIERHFLSLIGIVLHL